MSNKKKKVYIVNHSGHDFAPAEKFGELVFLSDGSINKFEVNDMYRQMLPLLRESDPEDFILPTSLPILSIVAIGIFISLHNRMNVLLYDAAKSKYVSRTIVFEDRRE